MYVCTQIYQNWRKFCLHPVVVEDGIYQTPRTFVAASELLNIVFNKN
jgi:hypothetical protein